MYSLDKIFKYTTINMIAIVVRKYETKSQMRILKLRNKCSKCSFFINRVYSCKQYCAIKVLY